MNVNRAAVRLLACGLCSRRRKLTHVCHLAVTTNVVKVENVTKAPNKLSVKVEVEREAYLKSFKTRN